MASLLSGNAAVDFDEPPDKLHGLIEGQMHQGLDRRVDDLANVFEGREVEALRQRQVERQPRIGGSAAMSQRNSRVSASMPAIVTPCRGRMSNVA